jgi:ATP-dependent exoDNAse (exonuclease V) beta subunit
VLEDPFARIRAALRDNLFVEAGAGTGKTKALVDRVTGLVAAGVPITEIVAITFTEKAAAELRQRVRSELEGLRAHDGDNGYFAAALERLDAAPISTIHAFAAGVVRAFAAEAGVDPDYRVLDEIAAERRFQQRWRDHLEQLGEQTAGREAFARALRLGMWPGDIEQLARALWTRPDRARLVATMGSGPPVRWPNLESWHEALAAVPVEEKPAGDELAARIRRLRDLVALLIPAPDAGREALIAGAGIAGMSLNKSNRGTWPNKPEVTALGEEVRDGMVAVLQALREDALRGILPAIAGFVLDDAERRKREGTLTFDDLVGIARDLVTGNADVRRMLRGRYRTLLIDEFQDTDEWQFAIAQAFATDPETGALEAGRLFLVGDPRQSIYRFRGADMEIYAAAKSAVGLASLTLNRSARSVLPIVDWVNRVFAQLFGPGEEGISPGYTPMEATRPDQPSGHPVATIGGLARGNATAVRKVEAAHVADACLRVVADSWEVVDRQTGVMRTACYRDIAILIPTRTMLPDIDRALEAVGIPARVESGSLVFQTQEIRDLVNVLAAIDDPADGISIVAALRSPAFACSDSELAAHRLRGGSFNYVNPANPPGPVTEALARLRAFHDGRRARSLAGLVQAVLAETGLVASAVYDRASRDTFRRARFVVEQARRFEADGPQPLRAFIAWLEERMATPLVDHEGTALDDDEDAVRILTVHGSKGLEFPIVVMAGFGSNPRTPSRPAHGIERSTGEVAFHAGAEGRRFMAGPLERVWAREKRHAEAEHLRLLYVAATRARDHLMVSLYRNERSGRSGAALLAGAGAADGVPALPPLSAVDVAPAPVRPGAIAVELPAWLNMEHILAARARMIEDAQRVRTTSATALTRDPGTSPDTKDGRDDDTEPWSRGRGGTRLGRAVHAVIQSVPLDADAPTVAAFARAQAVAEAIPEREDEVAGLAARALASEAMARARTARRALREVPFAVEMDGVIVEGFVDLLIDNDDGLEIVDWKTDQVTPQAVDGRLGEYRLQAGLYVLALERATGQRVRRVTYVLLSAGREYDFGEPAGLAGEAAAVLAARYR